MNNYTIDASIYMMPDVNNLSSIDKAKKYREFINRISTLHEILQPIKKDVKLYFFRKDIKLLINNKKLFNKEKLNELKKLNLGEKYKSQLDNLCDFYISFIENLTVQGYDNVQNKIYSKYITIESHLDMNINDINIESTPICEPDVESISNDITIINLFKNKMIYFAFLNKYIYLNSRLNKLLSNPEFPNNEIKVTAKAKKVTHKYLIDEIPKNHFKIDKQTVEFSKFINILQREEQFETIEQAYLKAKNDFSETLIFNSKVNDSIKKYKEKMLEILKHNPDKSIVINHVKECPYTLYDHLDSLDKLVKYFKCTKQIPINKRKPILNKFIRKYNDKSTCYLEKEIVCKKCSAFLKFCRYDCSGEKATEERIIDGKLYQIHLKPYEYGKDGGNKEIADLTLRIYFRWDDDKIQVGYIGKHLPQNPLTFPNPSHYNKIGE